jgi:6-phosphogluconolactonase
MRERDVRVFADATALCAAAEEEFAKRCDDAITEHGIFTVALSGGSTPRALYERLAVCDLPWDRVELFFGDERCVPPDHKDSNYRMVRETLIAKVPVLGENVHRMRGEHKDPKIAAREYEIELETAFQLPFGDYPRFDLVLMGLGADGHTASLFPGSTALNERRLVCATHVAKLDAWRITLTQSVFDHAACALFLVAGAEKAAALRSVLQPKPGEELLPAALIDPVNGEILWFVDQAAAGGRRGT